MGGLEREGAGGSMEDVGLAMGYEKFIMSADQAGMMAVFAKGVDMCANGQALDAIAEVGPGSHFLGCAHTQKNFKTAFYQSNVSEQWVEDGSTSAEDRAEQVYKTMLNEYTPPELGPDVDARLLKYMADRKASFPDSNIS